MNHSIQNILNNIRNENLLEAYDTLKDLQKKYPEDDILTIFKLIFNFQYANQKIPNLKLLNLGCGYNYHPDWTNVDFIQTGENVVQFDLTKGIPFEENLFDVVYHSHLLEHFPKRFAPVFIKECYRVLKPGGVIRVVVPDLEQIAKLYLENLQMALKGDESAKVRYEWILLELFDQMVRNVSGGEMYEFWRQYPLPCEDFIYQRVGFEAKKAIEEIRKYGNIISPKDYKSRQPVFETDPLTIGRFRISGEVHQWMYDRFSLKELLSQAGFVEIEVVSAQVSRIPDFEKYFLDTNPDGSIRKPDSLFMEAVKPRDFDDNTSFFLSSKTESPKITSTSLPKVVHLSVWDKGGAGLAALRLHLGLLRFGVDSKFLTLHKQTDTPYVYQVERKFFAKDWDWNSYISIWYQNLDKQYPNRLIDAEIFSSIKGIAELKNNEFIRNADIINFHWVSSLVDFDEDLAIFKDKKIVWTLHDENPFTGGCHYTSGCNNFETQCKLCPQLNSFVENDLSSAQFFLKSNFVDKNNIIIITPSRWMLERVKKSKLLKYKPVFNIQNGIPTGIFHYYHKETSRKLLNLPSESFLILFGAEYQNKRKGFHFLNEIIAKLPETINGRKVELVVFGIVKSQIKQSKIPINYLGFISNQTILAMLYSAADVFLMLTMEDNLPNTAIESICCGTPVVAFDIGGLSDIVDHKVNGWLAKPFSFDEIVQGIIYSHNIDDNSRICFSKEAQLKFGDFTQASNYTELYKSLMSSSKFQMIGTPASNDNFNFDKISDDKQIVLAFKNYLQNFSGLDIDNLKEIISFSNLSIFRYLNLFISRILYTLNFGTSNICLISSIENPIILEISDLFLINSVFINYTKTNFVEEKSSQNSSIIECSFDKVHEVVTNLRPYAVFFYLNFDEFLLYQGKPESNFSVLLNLFADFQVFIFLKINLKRIATLRSILHYSRFISDDAIIKVFDQLENDDELLVETEDSEKFTLIILKYAPKNVDLIRFKNINIIKNYQYELPKISIVTPNYNHGKYLEESINSVINQNYPNLEYVIIDGGSSDNSLEIIKKYQKYLNRWVSEKDNGNYDAINKGFSFVSGDILAWINADDFYLPGAFYFVAEFFNTFSKSSWVTTSNITTVTGSEIQPNWGSKKYNLDKILSGSFDKPFIQQESTFWTKEIWSKTGGYLNTNYKMAADLELWIRFFQATNLYVFACPLAVFRFHSDSKTGKGFDKYMLDCYWLVDEKKFSVKIDRESNQVGNGINISFFDFCEKSGLKIIEPQLEKIINDYEKLTYYPRNTFNKRVIDNWVKLLKSFHEIWNQKWHAK